MTNMILTSRSSRYYLMVMLLSGGLSLGGCTLPDYVSEKLPSLSSLSFEKTPSRRDFSALRRANYAAADVLYQKAQSRMDHTYKIKLVQLNNLGEPLAAGTAPIEWLVPQQVGNRLAELGMMVNQPIKAPLNSADKRAAGTLPLQLTNNGSIQPANSQSPRKPGWVYVEGDYAYLHDELLISLRLVGGRSNTVLSSVEYDMKVDSDLYTLLDPRANDRIFGNEWMH